MAFEDVTLKVEPQYKAMQFKGTYEDAQAMLSAINVALTGHWVVRCEVIGIDAGPDTIEWRVNFMLPTGVATEIYASWWVVLDATTGLIAFFNDTDYRAKFNLPPSMQEPTE